MEFKIDDEKIEKALYRTLNDILFEELKSNVLSSFVRHEIIERLSDEIVEKTIKKMFSKEELKSILKEVFEEKLGNVFQNQDGGEE